MNFISKVLERTDNEPPFLLIPSGLSSESAEVPEIYRKLKDRVIQYYD